jgi:hypothetical protein
MHSHLSGIQHINNRIIEYTKQEERGKIYDSKGKLDGNDESRPRRRTVLICDDERDLLLIFAIELETKYNVMTAASG